MRVRVFVESVEIITFIPPDRSGQVPIKLGQVVLAGS